MLTLPCFCCAITTGLIHPYLRDTPQIEHVPSDYKLRRMVAMGYRVVVTMDPTVAAKPDATSQVLVLNSRRRPFTIIKYEISS